ncbi:MAG TPA: hypothetical protein VMS76_20340, partial [Planctomycetota bacterium]|nr:hypothetical protein [Planctomycetota bacterium]
MRNCYGSRAVLLALILPVLACTRGNSSFDGNTQNGGDPLSLSLGQRGTIRTDPATGQRYVLDAHHGGQGTALHVTEVLCGRLVDLYDLDPVAGERLLLRELLVAEDVATDPSSADFRLERVPATGRERLIIVHPLGSLAFERAFEGLERGLRRLPARALEPGAPWVPSVPRDGALALAFDDLLDEESLRGAVQVLAGDPPLAPFNARVLLDPSHGDVAFGRFRSTRVLIDLEVSPQEALASGVDVNAGLPPARSAGSSNARLLLRAEPGLRNLSGRTLAEPVEWAFRSSPSGMAGETAGGGASALSGAGPRIL